MSHHPLAGVEFALFASQALWVCVLLFCWLLCHRNVKVPPYRGARRHKAPLDAGRAPSHWRAKSDWVRREIIYLASHLPSCRQVQAVFNRAHGYWETVGHTLVWEVMRDHAEEIQQLRRKRKRRKPCFIPVGRTWALDLTFIRSPHGFTFTVLAIIDAGSRTLLRAVVLPRKCACAILGQVLLAASEFAPARRDPHGQRGDVHRPSLAGDAQGHEHSRPARPAPAALA